MTTRTIAWAVLMLSTAMVVGALRAQAEQDVMVGMPYSGVTLSGTPDDPIIENRSGRTIIAFTIDIVDTSGHLVDGGGQILAPSLLPAGLPDGKSLFARGIYPVGADFQSRNRAINSGAPAAARATLTSVTFADGQFVGTDERVFEELNKQIKAVREVGALAKAGAWDQLDALAQAFSQTGPNPPPGEDRVAYSIRQLTTMRLLGTRKFKGDAAATQLAEIYSSLPTPRKH